MTSRRNSCSRPTPSLAQPGSTPGRDAHGALLGATHELAERLTAINNYLAAALALCDSELPNPLAKSGHRKMLQKAMAQTDKTNAAMTELRRLLVAHVSTLCQSSYTAGNTTCNGMAETQSCDLELETEARPTLLNGGSADGERHAVWRSPGGRRDGSPEPLAEIHFAGWRFDPESRRLISQEDEPVYLTTAQFELLTALVHNPNRVLSRDRLLDLSRGRNADLFDRAIDVHICRLRRKIGDDPKRPALIKTVRGGGYMFTPPVKPT